MMMYKEERMDGINMDKYKEEKMYMKERMDWTNMDKYKEKMKTTTRLTILALMRGNYQGGRKYLIKVGRMMKPNRGVTPPTKLAASQALRRGL